MSEIFDYYLVAGEIVFSQKDDHKQEPQSVRSNAVVMVSNGQFAVPQIARAQQALQQNLFNRLGEEAQEINVLDVVILGLMPLGSFTKEQFNQPPTPIVE